jgi:hypothetical protein
MLCSTLPTTLPTSSNSSYASMIAIFLATHHVLVVALLAPWSRNTDTSSRCRTVPLALYTTLVPSSSSSNKLNVAHVVVDCGHQQRVLIDVRCRYNDLTVRLVGQDVDYHGRGTVSVCLKGRFGEVASILLGRVLDRAIDVLRIV